MEIPCITISDVANSTIVDRDYNNNTIQIYTIGLSCFQIAPKENDSSYTLSNETKKKKRMYERDVQIVILPVQVHSLIYTSSTCSAKHFIILRF